MKNPPRVRKSVYDLSPKELRAVPCEQLRNMSAEAQAYIVETVCSDLRANGFPFHKPSERELEEGMKQVIQKDASNMFRAGVLRLGRAGSFIANSFHPQMWSVRCHGFTTPMEAFSSDKKLRIVIGKAMQYKRNLGDGSLRSMFQMAPHVQMVSNFSPAVAKFFMRGSDSVLDPCAGFGGRMVGAFAAGVGRYVGVDPASVTQNNNVMLASKLSEIVRRIAPAYRIPQVSLETMPFEDYQSDEQFDLVMTSPPYFDIEKYSNEGTQSYLRYPTLEKWCEGFLKPLVEHSHSFLKRDKYFVLNVNDPLVPHVMLYAKPLFGSPIRQLRMTLSRRTGKSHAPLPGDPVFVKTEPILIFKKPL